MLGEDQYRALLDQLTDGVVALSEDGVILYANPGFAWLLDIPLDKAMGSKMEDFVAKDDAGQYRALIVSSSESLSRRTVHLRSNAGIEIPFLLSVRRVSKAGPVVLCGVISDQTERIRVEEKLRRTNEELERRVAERTENLELANLNLARSNTELRNFAYVASHDLKEPLRTISGFLEILAMDYGDRLDDKARGYIERSVRASSRLHGMIDDLLSFSRLETRKNAFVEVDLQDILTAALHDLDKEVNDNHAKITVDKLPVVHADDQQMALVFRSLIDNGIKFHGKSPPRIDISTKRKGDEWIITFKDNGIGIEPANHERIFVMFTRLHSWDQYPGNGIGLAMCKKIIERHGGRIWVESRMGKGSSFKFTLPDHEGFLSKMARIESKPPSAADATVEPRS